MIADTLLILFISIGTALLSEGNGAVGLSDERWISQDVGEECGHVWHHLFGAARSFRVLPTISTVLTVKAVT